MAKNKSILKIEGTLDGMTFYKTANGHYVRTKGGISKDKIMNDPAFARTRENMQEFKHVSKNSQFVRRALGGLLSKAKDNRVSNRLSSILSQIKKLDLQSARGARQVAIGLQDPNGKVLLKGFEFNKRAPLWQVLLKDYSLDVQTGHFSLTDFIPETDLHAPEGGNQVQFSLAAIRMDFTTGSFDKNLVNGALLPLDMTAQTLDLSLGSLPSGSGVLVFVLLIEFFQLLNEQSYPLRNGAFNVLHILDVV